MSPEAKDVALLWDMLEAAKAVQDFLKTKTFEDYLISRMLRSVVERQLEIVGEAAKRVSKDFADAHPEIPWKNITDQRDFVIHHYGAVDDGLMWETATIEMPTLIERLQGLLPPLPSDQ